MENFIIRIYRRGKDSREITGLVEQVEMNEQRHFTCFDELRAILSMRPIKTRRMGGSLHHRDGRKDETDCENQCRVRLVH